MGDKATAKETMKKAGVPCVPGSAGILKDVKDAIATAKKVGYPVMIKATAGGGGKGMRAVWKEEDMTKLFESAVQEATAAFGNGGMYMEKLIEEPRHIEIQVVGDQFGKACHLSERDCSVQRRHQKLTEEEGYDPQSDEYYEEIDRRIKVDFPHKFGTTNTKPINTAVQNVASASRSTAKVGRKVVRLTPSQVAIAKKFGVPLQEYAKQLNITKEV